MARDIHEISLYHKDKTQCNAIAEAIAAASKAARFAVAEISSSGLVRSDSTSVAMTGLKVMHGSCPGENTHSLRSDHKRTQFSDLLSDLVITSPPCGVGGAAAMAGNAKASGLIGYSGAFALVDAVHWAQVLLACCCCYCCNHCVDCAISLLPLNHISSQ